MVLSRALLRREAPLPKDNDSHHLRCAFWLLIAGRFGKAPIVAARAPAQALLQDGLIPSGLIVFSVSNS
jgi:hypothetical protein